MPKMAIFMLIHHSSFCLPRIPWPLEENNKDTPNDRMVFCDKSEMYRQNVIHNGTEIPCSMVT